MSRKMLIAVTALLATTLIGAGCNSQTASNEPIKIGFIGPLTGDVSSVGTVNKVGIQVAVDEINQSGGINGHPLTVIYEDGQCSGKVATNAANKLINVDQVTAIIGGLCSTETAAFAPAAMQKKVIVFSYGSSAPSLSKTGKYFFRDYPSDAYQGKFAAEYAYNTLGARKVAILYHITEVGTASKDIFTARFTELGGTVVDTEGQPQESRDYRTAIAKIKNADADVIYSPTYPDGATVLVKQLGELGLQLPVLGTDGWSDPKFQKSAVGNLFYTEPKTHVSDEFNAKILAQTHDTAVPPATSNAYDAVKIIANAMSSAGTDPDKLADAIRATKMDGASGHIEFDQNGDLVGANYVVKKISGGKATLVQ